METKTSIRKQILGIRNTLSLCECEEKSDSIMRKVLSLKAVQQAKYVLCYADYKNEVMTKKLMEVLFEQGKELFLPKVSGEEMEFYCIISLQDLEEGYKGIPEPSVACKEVFTKELWEEYKEAVVMLLPGAAFSEKGGRIGYGKGYYDRYLMRIPCKERIAICYEFQVVEDIPTDVHDIPVTAIITDERIRYIETSRLSHGMEKN